MSLNGVESDLQLLDPATVNAIATSTFGVVELLRDGINIAGLNGVDDVLTEGYYNYTANVFESQNYTYSSISRFVNVTLVLDTTPPIIGDLYPVTPSPADYNATHLYAFLANVSDDVALGLVELDFNGTNHTGVPVGGGGDGFIFAIGTLEAGSYPYHLYVTDTSGNFAITSPATYVINPPVPVVPTVSITSISSLGGNVDIDFSVSDWVVGAKGMNHIHFHLDNVTGYTFANNFMLEHHQHHLSQLYLYHLLTIQQPRR